jgi:hypothetical protein
MRHRSRSEAEARLQNAIDEFAPALVVASGVAALVAYDVLAGGDGSRTNCTLWTLSAPLSLSCVRSVFGGRIVGLRVRHWIDVINPKDSPFVHPLRVDAPDFAQIELSFDRTLSDAQSIEQYMAPATMPDQVWRLLTSSTHRKSKKAPVLPGYLFFRPRAPRLRALLVGINHYPNSEHNLEGCINDVYLMSAALQEQGWGADNIKALTNERATSSQVRQKLGWLLDATADGDHRVFYFSGHGAVLPTEIDTTCEALATYDFDWSPDSCIRNELFGGTLHSASI